MLKLVDKLLLSRSGNYSLRVRLSLPLNSLNFNITGPNLSDFPANYHVFICPYLPSINVGWLISPTIPKVAELARKIRK